MFSIFIYKAITTESNTVLNQWTSIKGSVFPRMNWKVLTHKILTSYILALSLLSSGVPHTMKIRPDSEIQRDKISNIPILFISHHLIKFPELFKKYKISAFRFDTTMLSDGVVIARIGLKGISSVPFQYTYVNLPTF